LMDGVKDEFQPVGNPNLIVDDAEMVLNGLLSNGELRADFPVMPALHQVTDDGLFPVGEGVDRAEWFGGARLDRFSRVGDLPLGNPRLTFVNAVGAFDKELRVNRLENNPGCAIAYMVHR